jgi:hypothetical protein
VAAPKPGVVVLILLLLAVVVLFVVAVVRPRDETPPDWSGLKARFFGGSERDGGEEEAGLFSRVKRSEVQNLECAERIPAAGCTVTLLPSGSLLRRLSISATDQVAVELDDEKISKTIQVKLDRSFDDKKVDLLVTGSGGRLTLRCLAAQLPLPGTCSARLKLLPN